MPASVHLATLDYRVRKEGRKRRRGEGGTKNLNREQQKLIVITLTMLKHKKIIYYMVITKKILQEWKADSVKKGCCTKTTHPCEVMKMVGSTPANGYSYSTHTQHQIERGLCVILVQPEPCPLYKGLVDQQSDYSLRFYVF